MVGEAGQDVEGKAERLSKTTVKEEVEAGPSKVPPTLSVGKGNSGVWSSHELVDPESELYQGRQQEEKGTAEGRKAHEGARCSGIVKGAPWKRGRPCEEIPIWGCWQILGARGLACVVLGQEGRSRAELRPHSPGA